MATAASKRSRRRFIELACICLAVAALGAIVFPRNNTLRSAELSVQDNVLAWSGGRATLSDFVFVAIDDPSLKLELWPEDIAQSPSLAAMTAGWGRWPRSVYADAIERILGAGAKVVIVDLVLDSPRAGDEALKATLDRHPRQIVLGANLSYDSTNPDHPELSTPTFRLPSPTLIARPDEDPRVGFVNFFPDADDQTVRTARFSIRSGTGKYRALSAVAADFLGMGDRVPNDGKIHPFRFANPSGLRIVPFYTLFLASDWKRSLKDGAVFKDKIVVLGPSAPILHDIVLTPLGAMLPGPLVHANALAAIHNGSFYSRPSPGLLTTAVFLSAFLALGITVTFRNPVVALAILLGTCAALGLTAFGIAVGLAHLLPIVQPGSVLLAAGVACIAWNFGQERRESGRMRSTLERYVSRNVVREILDNRDDFLNALGGTRKPMTVFFSDVRGFTSFAEREDAQSIVGQLNEYLGEMVGVVFRHQGTVDKFMGDGIMAVWGNVVSEGAAKDAANAVSAALEMLGRLKDLNAAWTARGLAPFAIGIGLHHGEAVFGNIGSSEKMEPTVIGDTVNLASRVEGLTKKYGVPLCITQPLAELVADRFLFRSVDLVQVVGKSRPIEIFTVIGDCPAEMPGWIKCYEGAIADFRARRFAEAAEALRQCLEAEPGDKLSAMYLDRTAAFIASPPPEDWTGAEIATSK
ncbi:MAG: adenylate/guanylate cyclase domain-containing protein [Terrimicrobiaceae bacterium]|nr:adenylate/guanylate cyclase domain-containing protein [Terrimicrobiaceae bacterium]